MKLSQKSKYALRALIDMAGEPAESPVRLRDLAARNHIPLKFLEQIFLRLRHAGIVHSRVGARGGYSLARPPSEITVGEIIRMLDGEYGPVYCTKESAAERCTCPDPEVCPVCAVMVEVQAAVAGVIDRRTIADGAAQYRFARAQAQANSDFSI